MPHIGHKNAHVFAEKPVDNSIQLVSMRFFRIMAASANDFVRVLEGRFTQASYSFCPSFDYSGMQHRNGVSQNRIHFESPPC